MRKQLLLQTLFWASIAIVLAVASCSKIQDDDAVVNNERHNIVLTKAQTELVSVNNRFAMELANAVAAVNDKDFVISPLSVYYDLSMLCNGAVGETQEEILNVLGYDADKLDEVNEFCKYLYAELLSVDKTATLSMANAFVYNSAIIEAKEGYKTTLVNYYDALIKGFDFNRENGEALSFVNNWSKEETQGMIPQLFDRLDPEILTILMNAVCFNGKWANGGFKKSNTKKEIFTKEGGQEKKIEMMNTEAEMFVYGNESYGEVQIPYGNGGFAMNIILPVNGKTVEDVIPICRSFSQVLKRTVQLKMPKFETVVHTDLIPILKSLGIKSAFTPSADFGMITDVPMMIGEFFQKSRVEVDEKGTKAAAVTVATTVLGASLGWEDPGPLRFYADRPFIYQIVETSTGAILFMGVFRGE